MRKAIVFGAGNIGRGFLGQLLSQAGYQTIFVEVDQRLVELLNQEGKYPIEIMSDPGQVIEINHVSAIHANQVEKIVAEMTTTQIIVSAVGVEAVKSIIPTIARGLLARYLQHKKEPINIIICENLYGAADFFKKNILKELSSLLKEGPPQIEMEDYLRENLGLVESVIGRMVPLKEEKEKNPLLIKVEPFCELPVDKEGFKGEIPEIPYLLPADNFQSYVDRKLYTHNCGHAVCAYLGDYKGYTYIAEAIKDPWIREKVEKAMKDETGQALIKKHQLTPSTHWQYVDDLIKRFGNVALKDTVFRVARDPWRKLGPHDRLIGAAKLTLKYQIIPHCICLATAAALYYFHPADPYSQKLKQVREKEGVDGILEKVCQINPTGELAKLIKEKISVLGLRSKK